MSILSGLYNRATGLPSKAVYETFLGRKKAVYTRHAKAAAHTDKRFSGVLPDELFIHENEIIEVEVRDGRATNAVVRQRFNNEEDIVYAIFGPDSTAVSVATIWFNAWHDKHTHRRNLHRYVTVA